MLIPDHLLQTIRERVSIVEVVGAHVNLKRAGRAWKGSCPFHAEKTPSFTVNEERGTYKCFGCGKGGNVFTFLMEMEGKSFPEAAEALAARAGIELPKVEESGAEKEDRLNRNRIFDILTLAARYYRHQFTEGRAGEKAREYAARRGIGQDTAELFAIGAAPGGWDNLARYLSSKGVDLALAEKAGLLNKRESGGYYDRFRDRLIFPITDAMGRTISFGGRVVGEGEPKYLNGPESEVFHKGRVLYGLFQGAEALRKNNRAILVEGYMDVVILHQKGYPGCLATLGTALTRDHVEAIRRRADEAVLAYDGDDAGQNAMARSLPIFLAEGFPCRAVVLPKSEDPDSYVSKGGNLNTLIDKAGWLFDVVLERLSSRHDLSSVGGRLSAVDEALEILRPVTIERGRNEYAKRVAELLRVEEALIMKRLAQGGPSQPERSKAAAPVKEAPRDPQQLALLGVLLHHPARRKEFLSAGGEKWFEDEALKEAALFVAARPEPVDAFPLELLPQELQSLATSMVMEALEDDYYLSVTTLLESKRLKKMAEELLHRMAKAEERGDREEFSRLAREKGRIDQQLTGK